MNLWQLSFEERQLNFHINSRGPPPPPHQLHSCSFNFDKLWSLLAKDWGRTFEKKTTVVKETFILDGAPTQFITTQGGPLRGKRIKVKQSNQDCLLNEGERRLERDAKICSGAYGCRQRKTCTYWNRKKIPSYESRSADWCMPITIASIQNCFT